MFSPTLRHHKMRNFSHYFSAMADDKMMAVIVAIRLIKSNTKPKRSTFCVRHQTTHAFHLCEYDCVRDYPEASKGKHMPSAIHTAVNECTLILW